MVTGQKSSPYADDITVFPIINWKIIKKKSSMVDAIYALKKKFAFYKIKIELIYQIGEMNLYLNVDVEIKSN